MSNWHISWTQDVAHVYGSLATDIFREADERMKLEWTMFILVHVYTHTYVYNIYVYIYIVHMWSYMRWTYNIAFDVFSGTVFFETAKRLIVWRLARSGQAYFMTWSTLDSLKIGWLRYFQIIKMDGHDQFLTAVFFADPLMIIAICDGQTATSNKR